MIRKATSSRLLFNPIALTRFLEAATRSLTLDRNTSFGDLKKLADQLRNLDWNTRTVDPIGTLPDELVEETLARSRSLLS